LYFCLYFNLIISITTIEYPKISELSVDVNGMAKLMQELDASEASSPDGMSACFLKLFYAELAPILIFGFQAFSNQWSVPLDWKQANIVPIF